jgi:hypothetical protein
MKKKIIKACTLLLASSLLLSATVRGEEVLRKLKVVTEQANIRLNPSIGSIIIKQAPQGTILESTAQEGDWFLIQVTPDELEQVTGYVHESMVIIIEGPPKEQEEPEILIEEEVIEKPKEIVKPKEEEIIGEEEKIEETPPTPPVTPPPSQPVVTPPPSYKPPEFRFDLVFSVGGSYISGGDLNDGSKGLADYRSDVLALQQQGKAKPAHLSYILGGEFTLALSSHFSLGIGHHPS